MSRSAQGAPFTFAAALLILAVAGPVVAVLAGVSPREVAGAFAAPGIGDAVRVSLLASSLSTAMAALVGIPAGYAIARYGHRTRALLLLPLALPLAFPPVASGIVLLSVFGTRAALGSLLASHGAPVPDSLLGVCLAEFFVSGSFVAIAATAAFGALDPLYGDAARTLGASEARIFVRVALPAAAGNVVAGVAFAWLRAIGEYGATSILAFHPTTLPVALYVTLSASGVRESLALSYGFVVLAVAVLGVQWVLRRRVVL